MDASQVTFVSETGGKKPGGWTHRRIYMVEADLHTDDETTVVSAAQGVGGVGALPDIGDDHPSDASIVTSIAPERNEEHEGVWTIAVDYESPEDRETYERAKKLHPTDQEPIVEPDWVEVDVPLERAYQPGDSLGSPTVPVTAASGAPFANRPVITKYRLNLRITKNFSSWNHSYWKKFKNTRNLNKVTYLGYTFDPGEALMRNIEPVPKRDEEGNAYWKVTFDILQDEENFHNLDILNVAYYYLPEADSAGAPAGDSGDAVDIRKENEDRQEPAFLNSDGTLGPGDGRHPTDPLTFYPYLPINWYLPLPRKY